MRRTVSPDLVETWAIQAEEKIEEGLSKWDAYKEISQNYGVSIGTVYKWLTPGQKEKHKRCASVYRSQHKAEISEHRQRYHRQPEIRRARNEYMRKYKRTRYHLREYIDSLLSTSPTTLTPDELSERLTENTGFRFKSNTILRCLDKYEQDSFFP